MLLPIQLDRTSFKPLYFQISDALHNLIEVSDLRPGDRLPSENEIVNQFKISRNTARRALNALIVDGVAYTIQGKGTFVAPARTRTGLLNLTSFSEDVKSRGYVPGSRLLSFSREIPPPKIAQALQVRPGGETFKIDRLRLANGEPMAINTSYLSVALVPQLESINLETGSLYAYLEDQLGLPIEYGERIIKGGSAFEYEANLLHIPTAYPVVIAEGPSYLIDGSPIEYTKIIYRGDRYEFSFQVVRRRNYKD
ncbi:MAG: GntR family transcriptional regulator [Chloroflexi bacterium]|nr:GntR family transcriptional regulator [Chloroflexota bacterium]